MEIVDRWQNFVAAEQKNGSKLGKSLELAAYAGYDVETKVLTLGFPDEASKKKASGFSQKIINKLRQKPYNLLCDRLNYKVGAMTKKIVTKPQKIAPQNTTPLQVLFHVHSSLPYQNSTEDKKKESQQKKKILEDAVTADQHCQDYYDLMEKRTKMLAGGKENCFLLSCNWRLRVGGIRGYRELLLPAFHPVFGIPYIPASSLKGAAKAWGMKHDDPEKVKELLGTVDDDMAKTRAAKVSFLDAYPIKPCLSLDVATPQWHWKDEKSGVTYSPEPHLFLSLYQPELCIGISSSQLATDHPDFKLVTKWLKNALAQGIGSRVSSAYGKFIYPSNNRQQQLKFEFTLLTEGMRGGNPRQKGTEFRPTAVRGVMRYWFRALSLGMYEPSTCKLLEEQIFGTLSQPGLLGISPRVNPVVDSETRGLKPIRFTGSIELECQNPNYSASKSEKIRKFAGYLLLLASSLGGLGRGSRRPLHFLEANGTKMLRGCHWEVDSRSLSLEYPLICGVENWRKFFTLIKDSLTIVVKEIKSEIIKNAKLNNQLTPNFAIESRDYAPHLNGKRRQDVLDRNVAIYLIPCPDLIKPQVDIDWETEGIGEQIRGKGLVKLYSKDKFKGGALGVDVGGKFKTPSYVWIKSMFPYEEKPFQVITIFGANNQKRKEFAKYLEESDVKGINVSN